MAVTFVQGVATLSSGTATIKGTLPASVSAGDLLIAITRGATGTVSDTVNGNWTQFGAANVVGGWYFQNSGAAGTGLIITFTQGSAAARLLVDHFTGAQLLVLDTLGTSAGTAAVGANILTMSNSTGSVPASELIYVGVSGGQAQTYTKGTTNGVAMTSIATQGTISGGGVASEYLLSSAGGTQNSSINFGETLTAGYNGLQAAFRSIGVGTNLIQSTGTANLAAGSTLVTFPSSMTANNLIVVGVTLTNALSLGTVSSVTDNQNNTYTLAVKGTLSEATSVIDEEIWYAKNITGGAGTVTVNHTVDNCAVFAREYSGFNTLDVTSSATGSSTTPNTGTATTTVGTELLIVSTGDDKGATQTFTAAGAYGDMVGTTATLTDISMEDNLVTATGAQTGTLTLGNAANWVSLFASFYKSSGVAGFRNLLGVGV